jgi:hypothetical protein
VSMTQRRIAWIPPYGSRIVPGLRHCLFTLAFGIWGVSLVGQVPLCLIVNLRGGIDVTAQLPEVAIDPMRPLPPQIGQAERELRSAQWIVIVLGIAAIFAILYFTLWK